MVNVVMKQQRGRKGSKFDVINVEGEPSRLDPPADLTDGERSLFLQIVGACSPRHFVPSDLPLLTSFVQATLMARQTAGAPDKVGIWEKAVRVQGMLATRLRLAPQSRFDAKTNARQQPRVGPWPWDD